MSGLDGFELLFPFLYYLDTQTIVRRSAREVIAEETEFFDVLEGEFVTDVFLPLNG